MIMNVLPTIISPYMGMYHCCNTENVPHFVGHGVNSMPTAFPATTAHDPNTGAQAPGNATVVAAVVVVVILAAILAAVIGLVVILVIFRRKSKRSGTAVLYTSDGKDSLKELDNPMYSGNLPSTACMIINCIHV